MHTKGKATRPTYPQSVGNLALASDLINPQATKRQPPSPWLRLAQDVEEMEFANDVEDDPRAFFTGLVNGLRLSLTIWCLIALGILLLTS